MEDRQYNRLIEKITDPCVFIDHYQWIKDCNFVEIGPETILARSIMGEYSGYIAKENGADVGIAIVKKYNDMAFLVCVWCKNKALSFMSNFFEILRKEGYKKIRTSSYKNIEAYERLTKLKRLWSVYEGEL